jgi:hypothetical protein
MEATVFTGWIYDHLRPHAAALKVAHPPGGMNLRRLILLWRMRLQSRIDRKYIPSNEFVFIVENENEIDRFTL